MLYSPDFAREFIVQTDASERGIGAVLLQGLPGERRPVALISRKLFPREVRYSTVEKECLAVKWALNSLRYYLLGREFNIETDHKALQWLERMKMSMVESHGGIWLCSLSGLQSSMSLASPM